MACYDGPGYYEDTTKIVSIQKKLDKITDNLCRLCQEIEVKSKVPEWLQPWWKDHKEKDRRRRENKMRKEEAQKKLQKEKTKTEAERKAALRKLSKKEKKLLGIKE